MKRRPLLLATAAWPALWPAIGRASPQALVAAAEAGDLAALRRLLDAGTPVDVADGRQRTALLAATQANRIEAARRTARSCVCSWPAAPTSTSPMPKGLRRWRMPSSAGTQ